MSVWWWKRGGAERWGDGRERGGEVGRRESGGGKESEKEMEEGRATR